MNARFAPLFLALVLTGCPETALVCNVGEVRNGDGTMCVLDPARDGGVVQPDGGRDASTEDGGTDAGVTCEPACEAPRPVCIDLGGGDTGCVECDNSDQCGGNVCVDNECVECEDHGDCDEATPICDGGTCRQCITAGGECADRDATTPVCAASGRCTECGLGAEGACTSVGTCNLVTGACDGFGVDDRGICQSCTNDNQCAGTARCVRLEFPLGTPHTAPGEEGSGYCLLPVPTLPSVCERPYMTIIT